MTRLLSLLLVQSRSSIFNMKNIWRITKYRCDTTGTPYGEPIQSLCYTKELMESYKNPKFVLKIEEEDDNNNWKVIWERGDR